MATAVTKTIQPSQVQTFLKCSTDRACLLSGLFNKIFPLYGINRPLRIQHSIAQMSHESRGFLKKEEDLHYRAITLMKTWPNRFKDTTTAYQYAMQPEKIANYVYGNREDLRNDKPGDGWHFRGSGFVQITGKGNTSRYAKYKGLSDPYKVTELLRTNDELALDSACWFLAIHVRALDEMDRDDVKAVTKLVNGGTIGLDHRQQLLERAKKLFV